MKEILFYRPGDKGGEFSNFYPASFVDKEGRHWKTTEHYFQAMKFEGHLEHFTAVQNANSAAKSAQMGRDKNRPLRKDWEEVKDEIMMDAIRFKFSQHEDLRDVLISTGNKKLIEHTKNDRYWADGGDGRGKNMLGILLMNLRDELS